MIEHQPWDRVATYLEEHGVPSSATIAGLKGYTKAVLEWNRDISNIMSSNDEARFVERHILESLAALEFPSRIRAGAWVDLGSGAGLPALPLHLAGFGERWTLVESRRMKTLFLRKYLEDTGSRTVEVVCDRFEGFCLSESAQRAFDGMTSRATLRAGPTLKLAAEVLKPGGTLLLWKGSSWEREMAEDPLSGRWRIEERMTLADGPITVLRLVLDE